MRVMTSGMAWYTISLKNEMRVVTSGMVGCPASLKKWVKKMAAWAARKEIVVAQACGFS